jgi:ABC-type Co2+ transport system permease subunit
MAWMIVWGVLSLVAAALSARLLGRALRDRPAWLFWVANVAIFAVAMTFAVTSSFTANNALYGVALGVGCGGLAGLRYGFKDLFSVGSGSRS